MKEIISRCGFRCDICPAYKKNIKGREDQQKVSDGWFTYFGFRVPPEKICCDGCVSENFQTIDTECTVRPCVAEKGFETCAQCSSYICEKLQTRIVDYEKIVEKTGKPLSENEYVRFIKPYENKKRLDEMRKKKP